MDLYKGISLFIWEGEKGRVKMRGLLLFAGDLSLYL